MKSLFISVLVFALAVAAYSDDALVRNNQSAAEENNDESGDGTRFQKLGDEAFKDGYYQLAAKFYRRFKSGALKDNDAEALVNAHFSLIQVYCLTGDAVAAAKEYQEFTAKFAEKFSQDADLKNKAEYWNANILSTEGRYADSAEIFKTLLTRVHPENEFRFQIISGLAFSYARLKKWEEAEKSYGQLESEAKGTELEDFARSQKLLAVLMRGDVEKAHQLLAPDQTPEKPRAPAGEELLRVFFLNRDGKSQEALDLYKKLRKTAGGPDPLWFLTVYELAKSYLAKNETSTALPLLSDAEFFAGTDFDRQDVMLLIINTNASLGPENDKETIKSCQDFIKRFPDSARSNDVRLRLARIYHSTGKTKESLQSFDELLQSANAGINQKIEAAQEAAMMLIPEKRWIEAMEKLNFILKYTKDEKLAGETKFLVGEMLFQQKKYEDAAVLFSEIAEKYKDWREKAIFRRIQCFSEKKDYSKALSELKSYFSEYEKGECSQNALILEANCLLKNKLPNEALAKFTEFVEKFPSSPDAPESLFKAGCIAFSNLDYIRAEKLFSRVAADYVNSEFVPDALYRILYIHLILNNPDGAEKDVAALKERCPDSQFTISGLFALSDYYRDCKEYDKAEEILLKVAETYSEKPAVVAEALYYAAYTFSKAEKFTEASEQLEKLFTNYSGQSIVSEGYYLMGDVCSSENNWEKAIAYYTKAAESRPKSALYTAATGRIGDCYFSLAWKTTDGSNAKKAAEFYGKILEEKKITPGIRAQSLYGLAKCDELLGNKDSALARYHEIIYDYNIDFVSGKLRNSVWLVKAAQAAVRIYLDKKTPEAAQAAAGIYKRLVEMNVEPVEDYKKSINEISQKYKLKE